MADPHKTMMANPFDNKMVFFLNLDIKIEKSDTSPQRLAPSRVKILNLVCNEPCIVFNHVFVTITRYMFICYWERLGVMVY